MIEFTEIDISNIDTFSEMLPGELVAEYSEEVHIGFGITDDEKPVGCGIFTVDGSKIEILWIYVHPDYRGQGYARELLQSASERTPAGDNAFISARLLVPTHDSFANFLRYEGFYVHEDLTIDEDTRKLMGQDTVYVAIREGDTPVTEESADDNIMTAPGMDFIYPRFSRLEGFFEDRDYDADIVFERGELPHVEVYRPKCTVRFFIMPTEDGDISESFLLVGRSSVAVKNTQVKKMEAAMEDWANYHPMTSVNYIADDGITEFFAAALIEGAMPDDEQLESFVETVIFDVETFVNNVCGKKRGKVNG